MPFFPDEGEPHIHTHNGGATFTDVGHDHRNLVRGGPDRRGRFRRGRVLVYRGTVDAVVTDLRDRGDERSVQIADWIDENIPD